jgi:hypothetical protein
MQVHYKSWMNIQMNEPRDIGIRDRRSFYVIKGP